MVLSLGGRRGKREEIQRQREKRRMHEQAYIIESAFEPFARGRGEEEESEARRAGKHFLLCQTYSPNLAPSTYPPPPVPPPPPPPHSAADNPPSLAKSVLNRTSVWEGVLARLSGGPLVVSGYARRSLICFVTRPESGNQGALTLFLP